ncbi:MAG: cell division protein ZapA [Prevotella sp.]|nr:cell division protein ZapA [Prevotella sp.]
MAEDKNNKMNIRLHVYDEEINVSIERSEEEYYRRAAELITSRYNVYANLFKGRKSDHVIALMTLIDVALQYQKELGKNDTEPYDNVLSQLSAEIDEVIGKKK